MPYTFCFSPFPKHLYECRIDNRSPIVHNGTRPCFLFQPFGEEIWSAIMHHGSPATLPMCSPLDPVKKRHMRSGSRTTNVSSINRTRRGTLLGLDKRWKDWNGIGLGFLIWFGWTNDGIPAVLLSLRPQRHPKSQWRGQGNFGIMYASVQPMDGSRDWLKDMVWKIGRFREKPVKIEKNCSDFFTKFNFWNLSEKTKTAQFSW
jgi:hypothetical protein